MDFIMTVIMKQDQISGRVVVVVTVPVMNFDVVFCHEVQSAEPTAAFLSFQQCYDPFGFGRVSP